MKSLGTILLSVLLACPQPAQQTAPATQTAHPAQKTISSQLGLYAFPAKNQNGEQQQTDELSCYNWAKQDTAFDPLAALTAAQSAKSTSTGGRTAFRATTGGRRSHGSGERSCARSNRWRCGQRCSYRSGWRGPQRENCAEASTNGSSTTCTTASPATGPS